MIRRDDAQHRHDLMAKAIQTNSEKERSIADEISKVQAEFDMIQQDLSAAQQMESQTKMRVEAIENEASAERSRHADFVSDLETKSRELNEAKVKTSQSSQEKKALIEAKKAELRSIWNKCTELRKSEGHDVFPEPKWGEENAPSLDVARVRVRVTKEEEEFNAKQSECESLRKDMTDLDTLIGSNTTKAAEKRTEAEALSKDAEKVNAEEAQRKADIAKAVKEADLECQEVTKLRESIKDLTNTQEKNASDLKLKLDNEESNISAMEAEIASTLTELESVEKMTTDHKGRMEVEQAKVEKEIDAAKKTSEIIKVSVQARLVCKLLESTYH